MVDIASLAMITVCPRARQQRKQQSLTRTSSGGIHFVDVDYRESRDLNLRESAYKVFLRPKTSGIFLLILTIDDGAFTTFPPKTSL